MITNLILLGTLIYLIISTAFLVYLAILLLQFYRSPADALAFEGFARYIFKPFLILIFTGVSLLCTRIFVIILFVNTKLIRQSQIYLQLSDFVTSFHSKNDEILVM